MDAVLPPFDADIECARYVENLAQVDAESSDDSRYTSGSGRLDGKVRTDADDRLVSESGAVPCFSAAGMGNATGWVGTCSVKPADSRFSNHSGKLVGMKAWPGGV